jgi:hypothetical protein
MWYISVTSISVYFPATALRKDNLQFTENLFTYHGEAFHSSFYFLHYRAASLCMGHSVTTRNSLPTLRIQWENSKATIDPSNIYSVSCIRFCFCFLFMGEIRSPNLRAMQINHERAAPQRNTPFQALTLQLLKWIALLLALSFHHHLPEDCWRIYVSQVSWTWRFMVPTS